MGMINCVKKPVNIFFYLWVILAAHYIYGYSIIFNLFALAIIFLQIVSELYPKQIAINLLKLVVMSLLILASILAYSEGANITQLVIAALAIIVLIYLHLGDASKRIAVRVYLARGLVFLAFTICVFINSQPLHLSQWTILLLELLIFVFGWELTSKASRRENAFYVCIVVIFIYTYCVNFLADNQTGALASESRVFQLLGHFLLAVGICKIYRRDPNILNIVLVSILFSVITYTLSLIYVWNSFESPREAAWLVEAPFYDNVRHLGYYLIFSFSILFSVSVFYRNQYEKLFYLGWVVTFALLVWSGGRGTMLSALIAILLAIYLGRKHIDWSVTQKILVGLVIAVGLAITFQVEAFDFGINGLINKTLVQENATIGSGRLEIWMDTLQSAQERIWIGWGGDGFLFLTKLSSISQPHNSIIQILVEWGLIGIALVFCLISWFYLNILKQLIFAKATPDVYIYVGFIGATSLLILSLFDGIFYYGAPSMYLSFCFGIAWGANTKSRKEGENWGRCS